MPVNITHSRSSYNFKRYFGLYVRMEMISWWRGWEPTNRRNTGIRKDMIAKGNKKGNNPAQIADFADPPPWGGRTEGVACRRTPLPLQPIFRITNEETDQDRVDREVQQGPQQLQCIG